MSTNRTDNILSSTIHCTSRVSYPTCQDLGIPYSDFTCDDDGGDATSRRDVGYPNVSDLRQVFKLNGMTYDVRDPNNPFSPYCRIPLPSPFGPYEYGFEPAFIRKRNERERERVRCVNEGYQRLRQHLPIEGKDKRISKVETLRAAIRYIEHLQAVLGRLDSAATTTTGDPDRFQRREGRRQGYERKSEPFGGEQLMEEKQRTDSCHSEDGDDELF
ncbi:hypothetical protein LSH36_623g02011 [Paralvinella palmiformis]|uniref:BHLH domain-containing protein n=1 Tax=Paralvinella palmiformis TaxID=53620 RepID=A0AAD9J414_9ANNE|nr:hypothetical protein LSH36_623g02011 [Paralvinella palmiformis]